ncbi:MAG: glycoside hydrolase family 3 C-terminal domain-containing protein, partial [Asticcacaulis sp.]|nr:glycoside hydrolase family 3 C-terminal domain-containing protein [Asticcacaulis sp.]
AVIGGHADFGVISGGGSSQVSAVDSKTLDIQSNSAVFYASSPIEALRARTQAKVVYSDGSDVKAAAKLARGADIAIVFATQWTAEGMDTPDLNLPGQQNALIDAVTRANKHTVVVLETGGPVVMPWLDKAGAVIEAWYPGTSGGEAIARVLAGEVNPSGHLPVTFPASLDQTPRPVLDGDPKLDQLDESRPHTDYNIEGAAVGYKWFDKKGFKPLFAFGHGLSYSTFANSDLSASADGKGVQLSVVVTNTGHIAGRAVTQIYVAPAGDAGWEAPKRLGAFAKTELKPGESRTLSLKVDPRLLATYDPAAKTWTIKAGDYRIMTGNSAADMTGTVTIHLDEQTLDVRAQ